MKKNDIGFYVSLLIIAIVFFLLYSGSSILNVAIDTNDTIPLGTFITWAGIIAIPIAILLGVRKFRKPSGAAYKFLAGFLKILLLLAILWIPVSYFLSGNLGFNFSGKDSFRGGQLGMKWFWYYTYTIIILPIAIWLIHCVLTLYQWIKKKL